MSDIAKKIEETTAAANAQAAFISAEQKRIQEWQRRKEETKARFKFETKTSADSNSPRIDITVQHDKDLSEPIEKHECTMASFCAATGSPSLEFSNILFQQTLRAFGGKHDALEVNAVFQAMLSLKPADEIEGMLISRLIALHQHYMNSMGQTDRATTKEHRESHVNQATKLMRLFNETLEALSKYRRKGEQKVTVTHNHVEVNNGGKAIVGSEIKQ